MLDDEEMVVYGREEARAACVCCLSLRNVIDDHLAITNYNRLLHRARRHHEKV